MVATAPNKKMGKKLEKKQPKNSNKQQKLATIRRSGKNWQKSIKMAKVGNNGYRKPKNRKQWQKLAKIDKNR